MRNLFDKTTTILFILAILIGVPALGGEIETHYTKTMSVYKVNRDSVVLEDNSGNTWVYNTEANENFEIGSKVKVKMFTNYTDNTIYDDEIVKIKNL